MGSPSAPSQFFLLIKYTDPTLLETINLLTLRINLKFNGTEHYLWRFGTKPLKSLIAAFGIKFIFITLGSDIIH
jgi:hypothetical protein